MESNQNLNGGRPVRFAIVPVNQVMNDTNRTPHPNILSGKNLRTYSGPSIYDRTKPNERRSEATPGSRPESNPTSNQSEMIISTRDPLEELPPDLSYSEWFYYNIRSLRSKLTSNQTDSTQLVEPYLRKAVNEKIDPKEGKLLTQELDSNLLQSVQQLSSYRLSIDRNELDNISLPDTINNGESSTIRSPNGRKKRLLDKKKPCQLLLTIQPQITIIDRRPMLRRQALKEAKSIPSNMMSQPLISPEEDCDDDPQAAEIIEIDCD